MIVDGLKKSILNCAISGELSYKKDDDKDVDEMIREIEKTREKMILKKISKKDKYKEINTNFLPNIPNHWRVVRLGEIGNWGSGSTPERGNNDFYRNGTISWLKTGELNDGYVKESEEKITEFALTKNSFKINNKGDILIAMYGATIGKLGIATEKTTTNQACCGCSLYCNVNNLYLFYYLLSIRNKLISLGEGSGQPNISREKIINLPFPLPPLEEQQRIVDKIEEVFAKLDEIKPIEEELKLMKSTFPSDMRKSILSQAFCGNLLENSVDSDDVSKLELLVKKSNKKYVEIYSDDLPSTWKRFKFKDLFDIVNGFTPLRSNDEFWNKKEIPWFTIEDINLQGRTINHTKQFITKKALGKSSKRLLPPNTVLLCCTASVGEYAITNIPLTTNQQFNGFIIKDELKKYILPMYLYEFVKTLKPKLLSKSGKTTFNFLSTKKLSEFEIPIPPLEEQQRIVDKIEQLLPLCDDIEQLVTGD